MKVISLRLVSILIYIATFALILPFLLQTVLTHRSHFPHQRIAKYAAIALEAPPSWQPPPDSKLALSYRLSFSLLVDQPHGAEQEEGIFRWQIAEALEQMLIPQLLDPLSSLANFSVDSQVLYYSQLSPEQRLRKHLRVEDLQGFLSANDFDANSMLINDREHQLHFMLYVTARNRSVSIIDGGDQVNSFLIPRWGGVVIYERQEEGRELGVKQMLPAMEVFAGQLMYLLGMEHGEDIEDIRAIVEEAEKRWRSVHVFRALETLSSLSKLISDMTHMPVLDRVAQKVDTALDHLAIAMDKGSLKDARFAVQYAEEAFFDPTLVPQLYFPTEHMIGVHVPLALPVVLPVCLLFAHEVRRALKLRKELRKEKSD